MAQVNTPNLLTTLLTSCIRQNEPDWNYVERNERGLTSGGELNAVRVRAPEGRKKIIKTKRKPNNNNKRIKVKWSKKKKTQRETNADEHAMHAPGPVLIYTNVSPVLNDFGLW